MLSTRCIRFSFDYNSPDKTAIYRPNVNPIMANDGKVMQYNDLMKITKRF